MVYIAHAGSRSMDSSKPEMEASMQAALEAVWPQVPPTDEEQFSEWATKLRELVYDAEDAADSHLVRVSSKPRPSSRLWGAVLSRARRYNARRRLAAQIAGIRNEVREASQRRPRLTIPDATPRAVAFYQNAALVGMDKKAEEMMHLLSLQGDDDARLNVVAIVGPRGIGKTTLANEVYRRLRQKFDCGAFVSLGSDTKSVLCSILRQVNQSSGEKPEEGTEEEIIDRIKEVLEDKRYFIVVDDIWDYSSWEQIRCALEDRNRKCSSKLIITTTQGDAFAESSQLQKHTLGTLSADDSKRLFYCKVFGEDRCPPDFKYISEEILKSCGGLPLAIITIASLLKNKRTMYEWSGVCNSINSRNNSDEMDMGWILWPSYYDLPWELKPCFLYLSMFPKNHKIERDDLIWRWISEGFIHVKPDRSLYEVGEDYFNELINRSMVQPVHVDVHGAVQACRVHDIVHEFITSLSVKENFVTIINGRQHIQRTLYKIHRLSITSQKDESTRSHLQTKNSLSQVRSLNVFCHASDLKLPLRSFQVLRILDLEDCSSNNIGGDIYNLIQLRYLRLSGTNCVEVPEKIRNLLFLQTLDIKRTKVKALPSTLVQLRQLVRLCVNKQTLLPDDIGAMNSLEELSEVDTSNQPNLMEDLGKLCRLRVLEVSVGTWDRKHNEHFLRCLRNLRELQALHIDSPDAPLDFMLGIEWSSLTVQIGNLRRFTTSVHGKNGHIFSLSPSSIWSEFSPFSRLPTWIKPSLSNLYNLSIILNTLPREDLHILGSLPALRSLDLHVVKACTRERVENFGSTSTDSTVEFRRLSNFRFASRAAGLVFRQQAMPMLQVLSLRFDVAETKYVHGNFYLGLENLTSLKAVDIGIDCRCATRWEVLHAEAAIRTSIDLNPSHPNLDLHRHFVRETPWDAMMEISELEPTQEELEQSGIVKIGPWGGSRGRPYDVKVAPYCLESVTIRSDTVVHSLWFSYKDKKDQRHTAGPWGGYGGIQHKFHLEPSERVIKISGTIGPHGSLPIVVTSLQFITNIRIYGPYGMVRGHPFDIPVQRNGCIVGFFVHAGWFVDGIGVYVRPRDEQAELAKFSPWGGDGGTPRDIKTMAHYRLKIITIRSGTVIDSIKFSYTDPNGQYQTTYCWGGSGGNQNTLVNINYIKTCQHAYAEIDNRQSSCRFVSYAEFRLGPSEFLTGVYGSIGPFDGIPQVIRSLMFITNARSYGPFGTGGETPFHIPMRNNGCIVGFFGSSGKYLDAIGVYTSPRLEMTRQTEAAVARVGPWGGDEVGIHDIPVEPHRLETVTVFSGTVINSLEFSYTDSNGQQHNAGPWGRCGGDEHKILLDFRVYGKSFWNNLSIEAIFKCCNFSHIYHQQR